MKKPLIGLSMDSSQEKTYSDYPWYALRQNYSEAIGAFGGLPVMLSQNVDLVDEYLDLIDGLVVTGGNFDCHPSVYGEKSTSEILNLNSKRSEFDFTLIKRALERDVPFLGICAGQQMLNVVRGGTLIKHIPDDVQNPLNHAQEKLRHLPVHDIKITPETLLSKCNNNGDQSYVNTSHHQCVKATGEGLIVNAVAQDGVIEGIEDPSLRFCLGVQWHPEFLVCSMDQNIYKRFIKAALA